MSEPRWNANDAHRWLKCQVSETRRASRGRTSSLTSTGAQEHYFLEHLWKEAKVPPLPVDPTRADKFNIAVEFWKAQHDDAFADMCETEYRVDMSPITGRTPHTGIIDLLVLRGYELNVIDYKGGVGTFVPATHPEMALQGMAAAIQLGITEFYTLTTTVVQPFFYDEAVEVIRSHVWTRDELISLWNEVQKVISSPSPEAVPGDHCQYCSAALRCPEGLPAVLEALDIDKLEDRRTRTPGEYKSLPSMETGVMVRILRNEKAIGELVKYATGRVAEEAREKKLDPSYGIYYERQAVQGRDMVSEELCKKVLQEFDIPEDIMYEKRVAPKGRFTAALKKAGTPKEVIETILKRVYPTVYKDVITDEPDVPSTDIAQPVK